MARIIWGGIFQRKDMSELTTYETPERAESFIRPLAELSCCVELHVVDGGDEEEAQAETAAAISVTVGDDLEALDHCDNVLASHAFAGDGAVSDLVACG